LIALLPLLVYLIQPDWVKWARFALPDSVRWLGAVLAVSTIPVFWWILKSIGASISPTHSTRVGHRLVTNGPYRWVRHPLYSTGFVLVLALTLLAAMWWLAGAAILPLTILLMRTSKEEARLIEVFGDEYREYMKRTGRFVPKVGR
jgi:protein-S-isoprenylcysteine O-methyltransferase Ste14